MRAAATDHSEVRLLWAPESGHRLAGAWWPRSRDAATELRGLLPLVGEHMSGPVTRVSLNIDSWGQEQPRRLKVLDRVVRLGWFHTLDPAIVTLGRGTFHRITLVLVAPEIESAAGQRLMAQLSASSGWPDSTEEALAPGSLPEAKTA